MGTTEAGGFSFCFMPNEGRKDFSVYWEQAGRGLVFRRKSGCNYESQPVEASTPDEWAKAAKDQLGIVVSMPLTQEMPEFRDFDCMPLRDGNSRVLYSLLVGKSGKS
jgi:hypothetical protein